MSDSICLLSATFVAKVIVMINRFLETYGFDGCKGFLLSLFPSFKYGVAGQTLSVSAILGFISSLLGISVFLIPVMFVAIVIETWTGVKASKKQGIPFESYRFSRCVIKVFIWVSLFFMFHSFAMDMQTHDDWVHVAGFYFFEILHVATMMYFVIEYSTSILENLAVLDGKPKEALVVAFGAMFDNFISKMKGGRK